MKKILIILTIVIFLGSCKLYSVPEEYVILIDGDTATDLSGKIPVRLIRKQAAVKQVTCEKFALPTEPSIPSFTMAPNTSSKEAVPILVTHIEELRNYIDKHDDAIHDEYHAFLVRCNL